MGKTANCFAGRLQRQAAGRGLATKVVATLRAGGRLPWFYYSSVRRAAHLVTNSLEAADELVALHGLGRDRISVIHNSLVFQESAQHREADLRARLGAAPATTVLLCVGMFRPEKNQRDLLGIAAGFPQGWDWQLWFAGDGPQRARCERLSRRLGLGARVRFVGFQGDPRPFYRAADIAVHASREEALSNFVIEAQAHGLPAVACRALGMQECFIPGLTGWMVEQGDFEGFRRAVALIAADAPEERAARSAEARAFARASFDPGRQVSAYISLFESLRRG
jgi:glycosyltransferase involved in cell wall biosynthesis